MAHVSPRHNCAQRSEQRLLSKGPSFWHNPCCMTDLIVANHYRNWCKFTQVVRVREGQRRVEPTTQANCKDRPYLWRQIRSSLAKSSEACKAWAPSGDSTASWWCKSRCVRPPETTCIIQPWFRKNGYPTPSEHGFRPHEEQSKSHNGSRGGYPTPQSHGC